MVLLHVGVASLSNNHESMLPVIAANIFGPENIQKRGNVLFDSGAQISLIRQETADCLGLKGKDISVTIAKVGGRRRGNENEGVQSPCQRNRQLEKTFHQSDRNPMHK
jgi:hypothetical protein